MFGKKLFIACSILILLSSCSKNSDSGATLPIVYGSTGVYVVGGDSRAVLWKDGEANYLFPADGYTLSSAKSVFVNGNDVYSIGSTYCLCGSRAARVYSNTDLVWKNGGLAYQILGGVTKIIVANGDVYMCGVVSGQATYWKNGTPVTLETRTSSAIGIFVSGNDVYVAGTVKDTVAGYVYNKAVYWKNGVATRLGLWESGANAVCVSGSDVYVAGYDSDNSFIQGQGSNNPTLPVIWKNGTLTKLPLLVATNMVSNSGTRGVESLFVSVSDVYAVGNVYVTNFGYSGYCWKNNNIEFSPSGSTGAFFKDVFVKGSDIYIAGGNNNNGPVYWKNQTLVALKGGDGFAQAIFVK